MRRKIADGLRSFREIGFTQVDIMFSPGTVGPLSRVGTSCPSHCEIPGG